MIALGWTNTNLAPPANIALVDAGALRILCAQEHQAMTARARLALQVRCFDKGIDFVPLAPSCAFSVQEAVDHPESSKCAKQLLTIEGFGQLTISLQLRTTAITDCASGKGWLASRKAHLDEMNDHADWLGSLADDIALRTSSVRRQGERLICDILVRREDADDAKQAIAEHIAQRDSDANACMALTGLWPPFSFVSQLNQKAPAQ